MGDWSIIHWNLKSSAQTWFCSKSFFSNNPLFGFMLCFLFHHGVAFFLFKILHFEFIVIISHKLMYFDPLTQGLENATAIFGVSHHFAQVFPLLSSKRWEGWEKQLGWVNLWVGQGIMVNLLVNYLYIMDFDNEWFLSPGWLLNFWGDFFHEMVGTLGFLNTLQGGLSLACTVRLHDCM